MSIDLQERWQENEGIFNNFLIFFWLSLNKFSKNVLTFNVTSVIITTVDESKTVCDEQAEAGEHMFDKMRRLPDAELEVMKAIWDNTPPMSTNDVMKVVSNEKNWNISTLLTLLSRLIDRGFLSSEKRGRERIYYPQVEREEYMEYETKNFIKKLHKNSFMSLVNTLYDNNDLTEQDMDELSRWLEEKKQNQ